MIVLSDVNLDEMRFSPDGRNVTFKFIDMDQGDDMGVIVCEAVYLFNYNNTFELGDGLACYVGEVTCEKIQQTVIERWLSDRHFSFSNMNGSTFLPTKLGFMNLHIEGGEVVIDIACNVVKRNDEVINC